MFADENAKPLTRAWCIFELLQTLILTGEQATFEGLLRCTSAGCLNSGDGSIDTAMEVVDLEAAEASNKRDEDVIKKLVVGQMGSFTSMHNLVKRDIMQIINKTREAANERFASHILQLLM